MATQPRQTTPADATVIGRLWSHANSWGSKTHARLDRLRAERRAQLVDVLKRGAA